MVVVMTIVDTHCHTGIHKYEPVEALLFHMERAQIDKGVLIQHAGETDNSYHVECLKAYPDRFASAMVVEPEDPSDLSLTTRRVTFFRFDEI